MANAYQLKFGECKEKVAHAYSYLDLSKIATIEGEPEREEKEGTTKEDAANTEVPTAKGFGAEATVTENLKEHVANLEAQT